MARAYPGAAEIWADARGDRPDAVVAGRSAADLHPEATGREVDLVIEDDDRGWLQFEEPHRFGDRPAALVVEGLGFQDQDPDRLLAGLDPAFPGKTREAVALGGKIPLPGDGIDRRPADVMAVVSILRTGIAQAGQDDHARSPLGQAAAQRPQVSASGSTTSASS